MKDSLAEAILGIPHRAGDKLPSIRELMRTLGAASGTVQKAVSALRQKGLLHSVPGKGIFCGNPRKSELETFSADSPWERFLGDLLSGYFLSEGNFPSKKELSLRYGISAYRLRQLLNEAVQKGLLVRKGKFGVAIPETERREDAEILFVTRTSALGNFRPASEREMDFLRFTYRIGAEKKFKLRLLGFDEESERLVDRSGVSRRVEDFPDAVGAILSTLLIQKPLRILNSLRTAPFPVSVWWEHPVDALDTAFLKKDAWAFYNSSFGKNPGKIVGEFLIRKGFRRAVYFSPYHASSWSKDRLAGLEESGLEIEARVDGKFASPWDFRHLASLDGPKFSVEFRAKKQEKRILKRLLKGAPMDVPWVTVNDETAGLLRELEEEKVFARMPYVVGFDNSAESYLLRLDSFDCNTEVLVRQMFSHLEWGLSNPSPSGVLREIPGKVVEK